MDIQRKCFEESNNVNPGWSFKFDEELQQYIALDSEMELQVDEFNEHWDTFRAGWQATKAQAVQSKQDLLDRVNARWQLAHEQCAENWNTYSSAQMDAFDWVEQDIKELLGEAQEPTND